MLTGLVRVRSTLCSMELLNVTDIITDKVRVTIKDTVKVTVKVTVRNKVKDVFITVV